MGEIVGQNDDKVDGVRNEDAKGIFADRFARFRDCVKIHEVLDNFVSLEMIVKAVTDAGLCLDFWACWQLHKHKGHIGSHRKNLFKESGDHCLPGVVSVGNKGEISRKGK